LSSNCSEDLANGVNLPLNPRQEKIKRFTQNKSLVFFFEVGDAFEVLAGVAEAHRGYRFKRQHLRYSALPPAAPGANII